MARRPKSGDVDKGHEADIPGGSATASGQVMTLPSPMVRGALSYSSVPADALPGERIIGYVALKIAERVFSRETRRRWAEKDLAGMARGIGCEAAAELADLPVENGYRGLYRKAGSDLADRQRAHRGRGRSQLGEPCGQPVGRAHVTIRRSPTQARGRTSAVSPEVKTVARRGRPRDVGEPSWPALTLGAGSRRPWRLAVAVLGQDLPSPRTTPNRRKARRRRPRPLARRSGVGAAGLPGDAAGIAFRVRGLSHSAPFGIDVL